MPKFSVKNAASRGVDGIACEDGMHAFRNALNPGIVRPKTFVNPSNNVREHRQLLDSTCA